MSHDSPAPAQAQLPAAMGQPRRRRSDEETARLMLDAALALVNRAGLTVSLDHISFEDVIRQAGVSRSAAYRRWPYKHLFFSDLLGELAQGAAPAAAVDQETGLAAIRTVLAERPERLRSPAGRHDVVAELIRVGAQHDFAAVYRSAEWRTYLALHATFLSLTEGELRERIQAALRQSERRFIARIADGWQRLTSALGYRLRPETGASFETVAALASAALRGNVIMALADPDLVERRVRGNPLGASAAADWSLVGLSAAATALAFLEPDPDIEWDEHRAAELLAMFGLDLGP